MHSSPPGPNLRCRVPGEGAVVTTSALSSVTFVFTAFPPFGGFHLGSSPPRRAVFALRGGSLTPLLADCTLVTSSRRGACTPLLVVLFLRLLFGPPFYPGVAPSLGVRGGRTRTGVSGLWPWLVRNKVLRPRRVVRRGKLPVEVCHVLCRLWFRCLHPPRCGSPLPGEPMSPVLHGLVVVFAQSPSVSFRLVAKRLFIFVCQNRDARRRARAAKRPRNHYNCRVKIFNH